MDNITILSVHGMKPDFLDFPIPELLQLTSMHQSTPKLQQLLEKEPLCQNVKEPYECRNSNIEYLPYIKLSYPTYSNYPDILQPSDQLFIDLNQICERSVLSYAFVLVLAQGKNYKDLKNHISNEELLKSYTQDENQKTNFQVFSGHRQNTREEQIQNIDFVTDFLDVKGTIDLKNPNRTYWLCEYHKPFDTCKDRPSHQDTLDHVFFGVEIAYNRKNKRHYTADYLLPSRVYLGPTSTSTPLAFIMNNLAQVKAEQIVLDPFVGTGGMLVPAAHFGAITFGSDIDARVIHGHGVGHLNKQATFQLPNDLQKPLMFYNFKQYKLPTPELIRQDCLNSSFQREFFDAIICDPPYGMRAVSRTTGKNKRNKVQEGQQDSEDLQESQVEEKKEQESINTDPQIQKVYIIPTKKIDHLQIYEQLFNAASRMLVPGGMLVYLYPFDRDHGAATLIDIPQHPMFILLNYCEEWLTLKKSRILITMRKRII